MKKILYVVNDLKFFLSHRLALAQAAHKQGYQVSVAGPDSPAAAMVREVGFGLYIIPFKRSSMQIKAELQTFIALYKIFKIIKPDLIHLLTIKPILYGGIAARLANCSCVIAAITGLGYVFSAKGLHAVVLRQFIKVFYFISLRISQAFTIFQNPDDRNLFVASHLIPAERTTVILGSGVDPDYYTFQPEPEGIFTVILAARLLWDKGVAEFVIAARQCLAENILAHFVLIGEIDNGNPNAVPLPQLQAWVEEGIIEWWGFQHDMRAVFAKAHIVCLPSIYREGVPRVLIEAASCGKAIITTDMPGCREIVSNHCNGLLIPPGDSTALVAAIKMLLTDAKLRQQMGQAGRNRVIESFSLQSVIARTLAVYDTHLKN